jgi:ABC-type multidrug transport system ATPase subunit
MILTGVEKKQGDFSLFVERLVVPCPGIYGLIGPNGSGKSTLAKLMAGLLEADRGVIDTGGLGPRDITFLSRKPYMMDDTVYNNLVYPLMLRKIKPDPGLIALSLDKMGFSGRDKQKARSLSGGEQQKLAFLRALIFRPRLIIADEAMTALDIDSLDFFESMILEEQKKDPIIWIIISHQMPHIRRLVNHVFFMYGGTIEAEGAAQELFSRHSVPHLEQYLRAYGG